MTAAARLRRRRRSGHRHPLRAPSSTPGTPSRGSARPTGAKPGTTRLGALELSGELGPDYGGLVRRDEARGVEIIAVRTVIPDLSAPPVDTHDVWLRLHLLSHRLIQPHGADMTGVFGLLTNVAWTSAGPVEAAGFNAHRLRAAVGT